MTWLSTCKRREHRADASKINVWHCNTNKNRCQQQQTVLQDADPRHPANSTGKHKPRHDGESYDHGRSAMNPSEARHFNNDAEPGELKLQIRDDEDNSHQGYESRKIFAAVSHMKEIGLSLQTVFL